LVQARLAGSFNRPDLLTEHGEPRHVAADLVDAAVTQGGHERRRFPVTEGRVGEQPLTG